MEKYQDKYLEYEKYIKMVDSHEHEGHHHHNEIEIDYSLAKENLSEDDFKTFIIYSCFKKAMSSAEGAEIIDIAADVYEQLKITEIDKPASSEFIKSLFSFDSIYKVMYDFLALAVDGKYQGKKMSQDYITGIIDSIVILRKFQRYNGFGDFEWTMGWNSSIDYSPKGQ